MAWLNTIQDNLFTVLAAIANVTVEEELGDLVDIVPPHIYMTGESGGETDEPVTIGATQGESFEFFDLVSVIRDDTNPDEAMRTHLDLVRNAVEDPLGTLIATKTVGVGDVLWTGVIEHRFGFKAGIDVAQFWARCQYRVAVRYSYTRGVL